MISLITLMIGVSHGWLPTCWRTGRPVRRRAVRDRCDRVAHHRDTVALWYWDLDGGGAAARATGPPHANPAFVFPEMTLTEFAPADWFPRVRRLPGALLQHSDSVGPTDVSAIKRWAKLMMIGEALISLTLATLVIARAVNIL